MDSTIYRAVARAIGVMRERMDEPITVDDMARSAMFSKFHFSRMFQQATGLSPGRFLAAIRLAEAKRLLLSTTATVTSISHRVGYSSVGTFSTRFSWSVGVSPIAYRHVGGVPSPTPAWPDRGATGRGQVRGHVLATPAIHHEGVFVGLFPARVAEGYPTAYTVLDGPGAYLMRNVPAGTWHLIAHCLGTDEPACLGHTGYYGAVTVPRNSAPATADVRLRPVRPDDPPVLLALPRPHASAPVLAAG